MTPGIALFRFLPYGAPELHACARRNMSRATVLSSGLMTMLFIAFALVMQHFGEPDLPMGPTPPGPRVVDLDSPRILEPPPLEETPRTPGVANADDGSVVPVPEDVADPAQTIPERGAVGPDPPGPPGDVDAKGTGEIVVPPQVRPGPDEYVYTEVLPEPVLRVQPVYSELAQRAGVDGTVVVRILVGVDGRVLDMGIERSIPLLDAAALEAARQWVFTPALANGRPVMVWVRVPFRFQLQ